MKLFNQLLSAAVLTISLCSQFAFAETDCSLEPTLVLDGAHRSFSNKSNEMIFLRNYYNYEENKNYTNLFYTNIEKGGEEINITEAVGYQLLQLGYNPKSFFPWGCERYLDYEIHVVQSEKNGCPIDEFGNVLLTYTSEENCFKHDNGSTYWLHKLGVWNKDYGFKAINTPGIEFVANCETVVKKNFLIVHGINFSNLISQKSKIIVIPIKDGYWGERKQQGSASEKSWWDKIKLIFWPS